MVRLLGKARVHSGMARKVEASLAVNVLNQALILKAHGGSDDSGDYIVVDQTPFRVGRRPDNNAQIPQPDVSGGHAEFRFEQGAWCLVDNNSTNGTFINGKRITGRSQVNIGDIVHFATKGFQIVPRIEQESAASFQTKIMGDSSEIKGMLDLVQIINEQRTYPYFQPIVDIRTNQTVGWEALGRACASDGPINPGALFMLASQNRVETKLSVRFRESAQFCAECRHCWPVSRGELLFFNLHPAEIGEARFIESLHEFSQSDLTKWYRIVLEMPESWVGNTQEMHGLVKEIRKRGMLVAYDDFGTGQSRIPDLISVPPDYLKLDRELVSSIHNQKVKQNLVKAIVDACRDLNVQTLGEGIETNEELQACIDLGVDLGQGFLLCRPKPAYSLFQANITTLPEKCPFVQLHLLPDRTL